MPPGVLPRYLAGYLPLLARTLACRTPPGRRWFPVATAEAATSALCLGGTQAGPQALLKSRALGTRQENGLRTAESGVVTRPQTKCRPPLNQHVGFGRGFDEACMNWRQTGESVRRMSPLECMPYSPDGRCNVNMIRLGCMCSAVLGIRRMGMYLHTCMDRCR